MKSATSDLDNLIAEFYEVWFRYHPEQATQAGVRGYEGELPPLSDDAVGALGNWLESTVVGLEEIPFSDLDNQGQLELELLFGVCRDEYQSILAADWRHRDPQGFLPFAALRRVEATAVSGDRDSLLSVLAKVPEYLSLACDQLARYPSLVPRFWLEIAIRDARAEMGYLQRLQEAFSGANEGEGRVRLATLCERAAEAVDGFIGFLQKKVAPSAEGTSSCGRQRFQERLRFRHHLGDETEAHLEMAKSCYRESRAELAELSLKHCGSQDPSFWLTKLPALEQDTQEPLAACRLRLRKLHRILADSGLFSLPQEQTLEVRAGGDLSARYPQYSAIRGGDRASSGLLFLRADETMAASGAQVEVDCLRYVWPGRHLQAMAAAAGVGERWVRRSHRNEAVRVGWALYTEQLLGDEAVITEPEQKLMRLLEQTRRALLALLDIELHVHGLALSGALIQLESLPGYDRAEAERELLQLTRNPTDALAALVNWHLLGALKEWTQRQSDARPLRQMHDELLAQGVVPVPLAVRQGLGTPAWEAVSAEVYNQ